MKNLFLIALSVFVSTGFAAEKKVESKIEAVTVFYQGAQVTRTFKASFVKGETELVLSQLENSIRGNSIQVLGNGSFTIKSFFTRTNYLEPKDYSKELIDLRNQLEMLKEKVEELQLDLSVLQDEENLILANKNIAGQQNGLQIEELQKAAAFYKTRLKEIRLEKLTANRAIQVNYKKQNKVNNQINQIRSISKESVEELVVKIDADKAGTANFMVSYYVPSASWTPFYQVNVIDVNQPIQLVYKANVTQNTGVNWEAVDLTLSTTEPNLSGQVPSISPWFLNFGQPELRFRGARSGTEQIFIDGVKVRGDVDIAKNKDEAEYGKSKTYKSSTLAQKAIFFEYTLTGKNTIPSNSLTEVVHIKDLEIDAKFEYQCVPKLDKDVFLVAKIYGWEDYNLLNGAARLYFERTFVGESYLDVESTEDTLGLSLGRDKNIVVTREKVIENSGGSNLSGNRKEKRSFEIVVRNNKKVPIKLVLTDQYPISVNKQISTKLTESSDAEVNEKNGILVWRLNIDASETKKLKLEYNVSYPKGSQINLNE